MPHLYTLREKHYWFLDGIPLMQHFTVLQDDGEQGWQAAYLAYHIASRLGAPIRVLLTESSSDKNARAQRAAQVKVGGRAAKVTVETRLVTDFSVNTVAENCKNTNGLFIPRHLIPDEKAARRFLKTLSCPLWLVSAESAMDGMAVLIGDPALDEALTRYAMTLSGRIKLPLAGFVHKDEYSLISKSNPDIIWQALTELSSIEITTALSQVNASLLFLSIAHFSLTDKLPINFVIYTES